MRTRAVRQLCPQRWQIENTKEYWYECRLYRCADGVRVEWVLHGIVGHSTLGRKSGEEKISKKKLKRLRPDLYRELYGTASAVVGVSR